MSLAVSILTIDMSVNSLFWRFTPRSTTFSQMVQFSTCWSHCLYCMLGFGSPWLFHSPLQICRCTPTRIRFLGFLSDSILQVFLIPQDKKIKFATLCVSILRSRTVSIKMPQWFAGKMISIVKHRQIFFGLQSAKDILRQRKMSTFVDFIFHRVAQNILTLNYLKN